MRRAQPALQKAFLFALRVLCAFARGFALLDNYQPATSSYLNSVCRSQRVAIHFSPATTGVPPCRLRLSGVGLE